METIMQVHGLTKNYKQFKAVHELNMTIRKGDIYGFLGQNGAGKTTTIRMMMGLIHPSAGSIELFGERVRPGANHLYRRIGSIIEFPGFYPNLTAVENLEMFRRLEGVKDRSCLEDALHTVGLWDARNRHAGQFSLGMKQRLGIARAILHRPEFLILDEPTNGLDPMGIKEIRQLIQDLARKRDMTILISSHILSEVEQLATRIGIVHKGVMLEETTLAELTDRNRQYVELQVDAIDRASDVLERELQIRDMHLQEGGVIRVYEKLTEAARMNRALIQDGVEVRSLMHRQDSLEDYFVRLIGGSAIA
ncbi:ABC transporter ATP-binding protein [Paenibacillus sp. HJGM_3]|uniref:ABC transporter ATP-binding protein n=1 Tax=Paenibacillus sp. HJGM_3 TaxID=3379816 RepID=UPI00385D802B